MTGSRAAISTAIGTPPLVTLERSSESEIEVRTIKTDCCRRMRFAVAFGDSATDDALGGKTWLTKCRHAEPKPSGTRPTVPTPATARPQTPHAPGRSIVR